MSLKNLYRKKSQRFKSYEARIAKQRAEELSSENNGEWLIRLIEAIKDAWKKQ